ncbi:MAG: hypothetical protein VB835_12085 [Pirellulales bacterium]
MADDFDPYFKWLAIPPDEQPPHHYRLLGIPRFVDDPDVIEHAADQRMMLMKSVQTGEHAEWSQRLLDEIARAKRCLLTPQDKSVYDFQLRQNLASGQGVHASDVLPPPMFPPPPPGSSPPPVELAAADAAAQTSGLEPAADASPFSGFLNKALKAGKDLQKKAGTAAKWAALLAEKKKIESMDLPRAFAALGHDVVSGGRFRDEFPELHDEIHRLAAHWREAAEHDEAAETLGEKAARAADRMREAITTGSILVKLDAVYARLGKAAFEQFGERSAAAVFTAAVVSCRLRLTEIDNAMSAGR